MVRFSVGPSIWKIDGAAMGAGCNENPVDSGELMTYRYFINTSRVSGPPSESNILFSMGDISDCLMD